MLHDVQIGDILLQKTDGRTLRLRRVARPNAEQEELLAGLKLPMPERLYAERDATEMDAPSASGTQALAQDAVQTFH